MFFTHPPPLRRRILPFHSPSYDPLSLQNLNSAKTVSGCNDSENGFQLKYSARNVVFYIKINVTLWETGVFCEYGNTDDVQQNKQKTENKTTPNKT